MGYLGTAIFWSRRMKFNTSNYVDEYILLCSRLCKKAEDYTKEKVARHNTAMRRINKLKKSMYMDFELTEEVYKVLLNC